MTDSVTLGLILDWLLKNAAAIGIIVAFITFIIKITRSLDKIKRDTTDTKNSVDNMKKEFKDIKTHNDTISRDLKSLSTSLESLEKKFEDSEKDQLEQRDQIDTLHKTLGSLDNELRLMRDSRVEETERNMILLRSIRASLKGLIEIGANGPVKESLSKLDEYLLKKGS